MTVNCMILISLCSVPDLDSGDLNVGDFHLETFSEATEVKFAKVDSEIIKSYIDTGEPM